MLSADQRVEATILGKAMRLGAMLWLDGNQPPGKRKWSKKKGELQITLSERARPLFGEVAEARLNALASSLNAKAVVRFKN